MGPLALELASRGPSASAPPPLAKWARLEDHVPGADKGYKGRDNKGRGRGGKGSLRLGFPQSTLAHVRWAEATSFSSVRFRVSLAAG